MGATWGGPAPLRFRVGDPVAAFIAAVLLIGFMALIAIATGNQNLQRDCLRLSAMEMTTSAECDRVVGEVAR